MEKEGRRNSILLQQFVCTFHHIFPLYLWNIGSFPIRELFWWRWVRRSGAKSVFGGTANNSSETSQRFFYFIFFLWCHKPKKKKAAALFIKMMMCSKHKVSFFVKFSGDDNIPLASRRKGSGQFYCLKGFVWVWCYFSSSPFHSL